VCGAVEYCRTPGNGPEAAKRRLLRRHRGCHRNEDQIRYAAGVIFGGPVVGQAAEAEKEKTCQESIE